MEASDYQPEELRKVTDACIGHAIEIGVFDRFSRSKLGPTPDVGLVVYDPAGSIFHPGDNTLNMVSARVKQAFDPDNILNPGRMG